MKKCLVLFVTMLLLANCKVQKYEWYEAKHPITTPVSKLQNPRIMYPDNPKVVDKEDELVKKFFPPTFVLILTFTIFVVVK